MNSFGEFLRNKREQLGLPLRKVAAELDIDTPILSKIERGEKLAHSFVLHPMSPLRKPWKPILLNCNILKIRVCFCTF